MWYGQPFSNVKSSTHMILLIDDSMNERGAYMQSEKSEKTASLKPQSQQSTASAIHTAVPPTKEISSSSAASMSPAAMIQLQKTVGNKGVAQLLKAQNKASAASTTTDTIQRKPDQTGLPDSLKTGIENLSSQSMDDVKVHYNSAKPADLQAHAYAQGSDIHVGPGQEKHLPHEAWHVVQQMQGRVKPTMQMKSHAINDDVSLEKEADVMGAKALMFGKSIQPVEGSTP